MIDLRLVNSHPEQKPLIRAVKRIFGNHNIPICSYAVESIAIQSKPSTISELLVDLCKAQVLGVDHIYIKFEKITITEDSSKLFSLIARFFELEIKISNAMSFNIKTWKQQLGATYTQMFGDKKKKKKKSCPFPD
jgi:hypothetical protein